MLSKQCHWDLGKTVTVRLVPVGAERVGQPLAEPHLCPHRPILLKGKLIITTITPSSCVSPGGLQEGSVSSDSTIQNMRKSRENVYLLGDGKRRRKGDREEEGESKREGGWVPEGAEAAVVGTGKRTRWTAALTNRPWGEANFTGPSCEGASWTAAVTCGSKTPGWGMLSSQRGGGDVKQHDLLEHILL